MATTFQSPAEVRLFWNRGDGTFLDDGRGAFSAAGSLAVGPYPVFVASADLNGDGKLDLAVVNRDGNDVSVLLNATPRGPLVRP